MKKLIFILTILGCKGTLEESDTVWRCVPKDAHENSVFTADPAAYTTSNPISYGTSDIYSCPIKDWILPVEENGDTVFIFHQEWFKALDTSLAYGTWDTKEACEETDCEVIVYGSGFGIHEPDTSRVAEFCCAHQGIFAGELLWECTNLSGTCTEVLALPD